MGLILPWEGKCVSAAAVHMYNSTTVQQYKAETKGREHG